MISKQAQNRNTDVRLEPIHVSEASMSGNSDCMRRSFELSVKCNRIVREPRLAALPEHRGNMTCCAKAAQGHVQVLQYDFFRRTVNGRHATDAS